MSLDRPDYSGMVNIDPHTILVVSDVERGRDNVIVNTNALVWTFLKQILMDFLTADKAISHVSVTHRTTNVLWRADIRARVSTDGGVTWTTIGEWSTNSIAFVYKHAYFTRTYGDDVRVRFEGRSENAVSSSEIQVARLAGDEYRRYIYV